VGSVDHVMNSHAGGEAERGDVPRIGEGFGNGDRSKKIVLEIVGSVTAESDGLIEHYIGRLHPVFDGGGVDVRLEAGTDLSCRLGCAVELRKGVVAAADHGQNVARGVADGPVGVLVGFHIAAGGYYILKMACPAAAALISGKAVEHGAVGGALKV